MSKSYHHTGILLYSVYCILNREEYSDGNFNREVLRALYMVDIWQESVLYLIAEPLITC